MKFSAKPLLALGVLTLSSQAAFAHLKHLSNIEMDWQVDNIARVSVIEANSHSGPMLYPLNTPKAVEIDGKQCLRAPLLAFDVSDDYLWDVDESITLQATFHLPSTPGYSITYDHVLGQKPLTLHDLDQKSGKVFHTENITLERASFANRLQAASDFFLGARDVAWGPQQKMPGELITLCDLKIVRDNPQPKPAKNANLKLTVNDENGQPSPVRVGLYNSSGRLVMPSDDALAFVRLYGHDKRRAFQLGNNAEHWPGLAKYIFYIDGNYSVDLPAGDYQLVISKGFEYELVNQAISIKAGNNSQTIDLKRWTNMPAKGWYSSDEHIHIGRDENENPDMNALMKAEDVHTGLFLQMGNIAEYFFEQYAFGKAGEYQVGNHAVVSGQEAPRNGDAGHTITMNGQKFYENEDYFHYGEFASQVHQDGGLWGIAHVMSNAVGADQALARTVPFGHVDFIEILQAGFMGTESYYDFLNMGYKLTPAAGTDFPYFFLPGTERYYAYTGNQKLSVDALYEAVKAGRTFVTSGPMFDFTVNGQNIGALLEVNAEEQIDVAVEVSINPDLDLLDRVELVEKGQVIASVKADGEGAEKLSMRHSFKAQNSTWLAVRAYGKEPSVYTAPNGMNIQRTQGHTAASFVIVDGDEFYGDRDQLAALTAKYKGHLEYFVKMRPNLMRYNERNHITQEALEANWDQGLEKMKSLLKKAHRVYDERLNKYGQQ